MVFPAKPFRCELFYLATRHWSARFGFGLRSLDQAKTCSTCRSDTIEFGTTCVLLSRVLDKKRNYIQYSVRKRSDCHFHNQTLANGAYSQFPIVPDALAFFNASPDRSRIELIFYEINRSKGNPGKKPRHAHELIGETAEQLYLLAAGCWRLLPHSFLSTANTANAFDFTIETEKLILPAALR